MSIHATERAVWAAATAIPGLVPTEFAPVGADRTKIRMSGWSPSLHAVGMEFTVPVGMSDPERLVAALRPFLDRQRRRSEDAAALGVGLPRHPRDREMPVTHLHADASMLALAIGEETRRMRDKGADEEEIRRDVVARVVDACRGRVGLAHMLQKPYDGGPALLDGGCRVDERGTIRSVGMSGMTIERGDERIPVSTRGLDTVVHLDAVLPEATLAAIVGGRMNGRPLRDLAVVDRLFDERVVAGAFRPGRGAGLIVALEPREVGLSDIVGMDAEDALAHLAAIAPATSEGRSGT